MKKVALAALATLLLAGTAAAGDYDINIPAGLPDSTFKDFLREAGAATAYRAIAPAEPLGLTGFDVGLSVSAVDIRNENWDAILEDTPDYLPVPRIHVRKGLPFNIDVGGFYSQVPDSNIELWGGEVQWAPLEGGVATPAVAIRAHYTTLQGVDDLDLDTYGADAVISKGIAFLTPYAGIGLVRIDGEYAGNDPNVAAALSDHDFTEPRYFGGLQASFLLLRVTAEAEYLDRPVYSLKASLGW